MSVRRAFYFAAGLGAALGATSAGRAAELPPTPPRLQVVPLEAPNVNQGLANTIAENLRQNRQLSDYLVDVAVRGSQVEVIGTVASQPQREEVLRIVQGVPGVERVVDRLVVKSSVSVGIVRTQGGDPPGKLPDPSPATPTLPPPLPPEEGKGGKLAEPIPLFRAAPPPSPYLLNPPKLPPYAWPTYAPYNNFSRVAYPEAYPQNAWPFIGPIHPFPKIPLGWRSVKLEWDDGYWWFSRVGNKYDWWKLRFW